MHAVLQSNVMIFQCAMETVYSKHLVNNKLSFKGKAILKQTRNMKSLDVLTQIA